MEVNCQLHAPVTLPPRKSPRYVLDIRLVDLRPGVDLDVLVLPAGKRTPVAQPVVNQVSQSDGWFTFLAGVLFFATTSRPALRPT
jgi:hypothetical protein